MEMKNYIVFQQLIYTGKTKRYEIVSIRNGDILGYIYWKKEWRQYVFNPTFSTVWSIGCLKDIQDFLDNLMNERKTEEK